MANKFEIRLSAVDGVTKVANRISRSIQGITSPYANLRKSLKTLGESSGVGKLNEGLRTVADTARNVADRIASIVPGLTAIGGALSLVGIGKLAADWGAFGFALTKTSRSLGMSTSDLQAWHIAAQKAGVAASEFDSSIASSQNTIRDARYGKNPEALMLMQRMGVQIAANRDGTIDYLTTQQRLMAAIGRQRSPVTQRNVASALGMEGLLPMIQRGTYGQDLANARSSGQIMTPAQIKSAEQFEDRIISLKQSLTNLGYSIGNAVTPPLQDFIVSMTSFFNDNKAQIVDTIGGAFKQIAEWIKSVDWKGVATDIGNLVTQIGGVKGVAIAIAAITFAGPIGGLLSLTSSLVSLTAITIPAAIKALAQLGAARTAAAAAAEAAAAGGGAAATGAGATAAGAVGAGGIIGGTLGLGALGLGVYGFLNFMKSITPGGHFVSRFDRNAHGGTGGGVPLGIRSNNPLNMLDHNNEITYATPEQGIAAAAANLRKGYRGLTLAALADKWTGGARTGNTPQQMANYVGILSRGTGLSADQTPDLNNPAVVAALLKAQIQAENGQQPYTDAQIKAGVGAALGGAPGAAVPAAIAGVGSQAFENDRETRAPVVNVTVHNALPGTKVDARGADGAYMPTKINYSMGNPSYGALP